MNDPAAVRVYVLTGADAAMALDWLHVHADLQGVMEEDLAITVWLAGELPTLPFADLAVRELPVDATQPPVTGLEQDTAILVAGDLLVRPPWVERPAGFAGIELLVPRGNAFGSGEHASTQAALCGTRPRASPTSAPAPASSRSTRRCAGVLPCRPATSKAPPWSPRKNCCPGLWCTSVAPTRCSPPTAWSPT